MVSTDYLEGTVLPKKNYRKEYKEFTGNIRRDKIK